MCIKFQLNKEEKYLLNTTNLKGVIDSLVDVFWAGGINNSYTIIEEISQLWIFRLIARKDNPQGEFHQDYLINIPAQDLWYYLKEFIELNKLDQEPIENEKALKEVLLVLNNAVRSLKNIYPEFRVEYMKDISFTVTNPRVIVKAHKIVDDFFQEHELTLMGELYGELLKTITTIGQWGQYVTPKHVIQPIVEMLAPRSEETVLDPACGSGGFLLETYNYLKGKEGSVNVNLYGADFDPTMARLAVYNLIFHDISNFSITHADSLAEGTITKNYDVIMVNPPFSIRYTDYLTNLIGGNSVRTTDQLFIELSIALLKELGRAAIIVPEGILFGNKSEFRRRLIGDYRIEGIVSLPQGIFKPFTLVKTSILFLSKWQNVRHQLATPCVWFYEISQESSTATGEGSFTDLLLRWKSRQRDWERWQQLSEQGTEKPQESFQPPKQWPFKKFFFVNHEELENNNFNLSMSHYKNVEEEIVAHVTPKELILTIQELDQEIQKNLQELNELLEDSKWQENKKEDQHEQMNQEKEEKTTVSEPENLDQIEAMDLYEGPLEIPQQFHKLFEKFSFPQQKLLETFYYENRPLAGHEATKLIQDTLKAHGYSKKFSVQEGKKSIEFFEVFGMLEREQAEMMEFPRLPEQEGTKNILNFEAKTTIERWQVPEDFKRRGR